MESVQERVTEQIVAPPTVMPQQQGVNPTQNRYGWNPFKDINLTTDGAQNPICQPYQIAGPDGKPMINPFFSKLPKGQLIPFTTFEYTEEKPSQDVRLPDGRPALVSTASIHPALHAMVLVLRVYARTGFTMLTSLQGIDQPKAQRIFRVVQPYNYLIGRAVGELQAADWRIAATEDIELENDYIIPALQDDAEREIAYRLRDEMVGGAGTALMIAGEELDATEMSMTNRASGGTGKAGPDPLDIYLCQQLERELPRLVGQPKQQPADNSGLEKKVDFLVDKEISREQAAEIEKLRAENEALRQKTNPKAETVFIPCGYPKTNGEPCRVGVHNEGDLCAAHNKIELAKASAETVAEGA